MPIMHIVDRVKKGHGRGLSALGIAEVQYLAGWDVALLLSGVHDSLLLPSGVPTRALLGDISADVYRRTDAIELVASALRRFTRPRDVLICHEGVDLAASCRLTNRHVVAAVHSDPRLCLGYLPSRELALIKTKTRHWIAWGGVVAGQVSAFFGINEKLITVSGQYLDPRITSMETLPGAPACLTPARVHPVKDHSLMLEALALLAERMPRLHWHMAGECGNQRYAGELQDRACRLGVESAVTWHGHRDDIANMMRGSDVVVLASKSEGVPRAIQEAMLLGIPTVSSSAFGHELRHAGLPVLYHSRDPFALAEAI
jgi:Glycosyl transferases group 1